MGRRVREIACIVGVLLFSLSVAGQVFATDPAIAGIKERARKLYFGIGVPRNYAESLALYMQAAAAGDPDAQYIAGGMYFKGMGTEVDYGKAFELLFKAARNGKSTVQSQRILAQAFLLGREVPKNYKEAVHWYTKAAENGDSEAQNELAFMYFTGNGVEQDYEKSYDLFYQAALNGHLLAQYNLGIMYYTGEGVPAADLAKSYAWFSIASSGGHAQAGQAGNFLETVLSANELKQAQNIAESLYGNLRTKR